MRNKKLKLLVGIFCGTMVLTTYQNCAPVHDQLSENSSSQIQTNNIDFTLPASLKVDLTNDCMACHPEASADRISVTGEDLNRIGWIIPENSGNSILIEYLETPSGPKRMPPSGPRWAQTEINDLKTWIDDLKPSDDTGGSTAVSYARDIAPIMEAKCTNCHGTRAGVNLESYGETRKHVSLSAPNDPLFSGLYRTMFEGTYSPNARTAMPPRGNNAATDQELQKIQDWIAQGAPP